MTFPLPQRYVLNGVPILDAGVASLTWSGRQTVPGALFSRLTSALATCRGDDMSPCLPSGLRHRILLGPLNHSVQAVCCRHLQQCSRLDRCVLDFDPFSSCADHRGETGVTNCPSCAAGSYTSLLGASVCALCAPGSFNALPSAISCARCSWGHFSSATGSTYCSACVAGTFSFSGPPLFHIASFGWRF